MDVIIEGMDVVGYIDLFCCKLGFILFFFYVNLDVVGFRILCLIFFFFEFLSLCKVMFILEFYIEICLRFYLSYFYVGIFMFVCILMIKR